MFNTLYRLGTCVSAESDDENGFVCAARNDSEAAVMVTHFNDDDNAEPKSFSIDLSGFGGENGAEVEFYLLDGARNCELVGKATYYGDRFIPELVMKNFDCYLIKIKKK